MHGEDDKIVPFETTGKITATLLKNGKLISYPGFPRGMPTRQKRKQSTKIYWSLSDFNFKKTYIFKPQLFNDCGLKIFCKLIKMWILNRSLSYSL